MNYGVTSITGQAFDGCIALKLLVVPDDLPIDNDRLGISSDTKIYTHTDFDNYFNYLNLNGSYSMQKKINIYELVNADKLANEQFQGLSSFIETADFNKIIGSLQKDRIPENVRKLHAAIMKSSEHWFTVTDHLTIDEYFMLSASSKSIL